MTKKLVTGIVSLILTGVALVAAPGTTWATIITVNSVLTNPSFEATVLASGGISNTCPSGWTCGGSPGPGFNYPKSPDQYTAGSDGLSGSKIVPDGNQAVFAPTAEAGSATFKQSTSLTYIGLNTYVFTFWVGLPKTLADGSKATFGFPSVKVSWTIGVVGVNDNLCGNGTGLGGPVGGPQSSLGSSACILSVTSPGLGQWEEWQISYTPDFSQFDGGGNVGVAFQVDTNSQPQSVNFDIASSTTNIERVPEPGTLLLLALGFGSFAFAHRRRNKVRR